LPGRTARRGDWNCLYSGAEFGGVLAAEHDDEHENGIAAAHDEPDKVEANQVQDSNNGGQNAEDG
jgi:hypothetical protein